MGDLETRVEDLERRVAELEAQLDEDEHSRILSAAKDQYDAGVLRLVIEAETDLVEDPDDFRELYNAVGITHGRKIAKRVNRLKDQFFERVDGNTYRLLDPEEVDRDNPLEA